MMTFNYPKKKKRLSPHEVQLCVHHRSERSTGVQNVRSLHQRLRIQGASGHHLQSPCLKMEGFKGFNTNFMVSNKRIKLATYG